MNAGDGAGFAEGPESILDQGPHHVDSAGSAPQHTEGFGSMRPKWSRKLRSSHRDISIENRHSTLT